MYLLKLKTRLLNLMITATFSEQNLWSGHICSMFLFPYHLIEIWNLYHVSHWILSIPFPLILVPRGGRFSDGWGSCERREKRFLKPNHDIPSTAETRAKNKACQVCVFLLNWVILTILIRSAVCFGLVSYAIFLFY